MAILDANRNVSPTSIWSGSDGMDGAARGRQMKDRPIKLPLVGIQLAACHGLPMLVVGLVVALLGFLIVVTASRMVSPVTLSTIWIETPHSTGHSLPQITPDDIGSVKLAKDGEWTRLCPSYAIETYFDNNGYQIAQSGRHRIDMPQATGPIDHAPRPIMLPHSITNTPGIYKVRLSDYSVCWPWENIFPINSTSAEAAFQIMGN